MSAQEYVLLPEQTLEKIIPREAVIAARFVPEGATADVEDNIKLSSDIIAFADCMRDQKVLFADDYKKLAEKVTTTQERHVASIKHKAVLLARGLEVARDLMIALDATTLTAHYLGQDIVRERAVAVGLEEDYKQSESAKRGLEEECSQLDEDRSRHSATVTDIRRKATPAYRLAQDQAPEGADPTDFVNREQLREHMSDEDRAEFDKSYDAIRELDEQTALLRQDIKAVAEHSAQIMQNILSVEYEIEKLETIKKVFEEEDYPQLRAFLDNLKTAIAAINRAAIEEQDDYNEDGCFVDAPIAGLGKAIKGLEDANIRPRPAEYSPERSDMLAKRRLMFEKSGDIHAPKLSDEAVKESAALFNASLKRMNELLANADSVAGDYDLLQEVHKDNLSKFYAAMDHYIEMALVRSDEALTQAMNDDTRNQQLSKDRQYWQNLKNQLRDNAVEVARVEIEASKVNDAIGERKAVMFSAERVIGELLLIAEAQHVENEKARLFHATNETPTQEEINAEMLVQYESGLCYQIDASLLSTQTRKFEQPSTATLSPENLGMYEAAKQRVEETIVAIEGLTQQLSVVKDGADGLTRQKTFLRGETEETQAVLDEAAAAERASKSASIAIRGAFKNLQQDYEKIVKTYMIAPAPASPEPKTIQATVMPEEEQQVPLPVNGGVSPMEAKKQLSNLQRKPNRFEKLKVAALMAGASILGPRQEK